MKRSIFHLGFFLSPLIPVILYLYSVGALADSYIQCQSYLVSTLSYLSATSFTWPHNRPG